VIVTHLERVRIPSITPQWAVRLLARTLGFHPGKTGSIPVLLTKEEEMKKTLALLVLALTLLSCSSTPTHYTVPQGYQTCRSNLDCAKGTYCGFVGVDTYAVCKQ
jgi:hypothetical protein